jgi:hypothetical protein
MIAELATPEQIEKVERDAETILDRCTTHIVELSQEGFAGTLEIGADLLEMQGTPTMVLIRRNVGRPLGADVLLSRHLADNGVAISRVRIGQLRGASAVMTALRSFETAVSKLPTTERQLRPLVRNELSAQASAKIWAEAGGDPKKVRAALKKRFPPEPKTRDQAAGQRAIGRLVARFGRQQVSAWLRQAEKDSKEEK